MRRKNQYAQWRREDLVARLHDLDKRIRVNQKSVNTLGPDCPRNVIDSLASQTADRALVQAALELKGATV